MNMHFIVKASNNPVISCDNIHINHSFLILSANKTIYKTKLKEYYLHQSMDSKKSADSSL